MSAHDMQLADHHHHDGHDDHDDGPHSTLSGYVTGFILSVILTAIPFWLVMADIITDRTMGVLVLGGFAMAQIVVHMIFFLHMNGKVQGGWTMVSAIFTIVFLAIVIAGTLWVMFHMNKNMMPSHDMQSMQSMQDMRGGPDVVHHGGQATS